ncbi:unnamed protein product [Rodentolepis nana]|uniref:DDE_Tnp_1_7 domain-containing protein n=1 Tax=Rodentolepis nana TaxID=102285 RepID=A0A0R3TQY8_RODNA|nr:unnamed protein product [Rodentolepis nana]
MPGIRRKKTQDGAVRILSRRGKCYYGMLISAFQPEGAVDPAKRKHCPLGAKATNQRGNRVSLHSTLTVDRLCSIWVDATKMQVKGARKLQICPRRLLQIFLLLLLSHPSVEEDEEEYEDISSESSVSLSEGRLGHRHDSGNTPSTPGPHHRLLLLVPQKAAKQVLH